jgi:hypothetical protein
MFDLKEFEKKKRTSPPFKLGRPISSLPQRPSSPPPFSFSSVPLTRRPHLSAPPSPSSPLPFLYCSGADRDTATSRASSAPPFHPRAPIKSRDPRARSPPPNILFPLPSLCRSAGGHQWQVRRPPPLPRFPFPFLSAPI